MGEYSVETKNRFQLALSDSEEEVDVYDILLKHEATKTDKKKNETSIATPEADNKTKNTKNVKGEKKDRAKKPGLKMDNTNVTNIQNTHNKQQSSTNASSTNNNFNNRGSENRPPRMRQQNAFPKAENFEKAPSSQEQSSGFGGRGKRGGGFRGRGGRGKRFDRHSGSDRTGVKPVEKRDGLGPHNWGAEIDAQLDTSVQEKPSADTAEKTDGEQTTINEESGAVEVEPAEPEVKEMTLDEWKAAQAGARTKQQFNVRRAGEGEDPKQWKKTVALEPRKRAESTESYEEEEHEMPGKNEATKATLDKLNIQIRFSEGARGGGGGGGGRGGGFRGRGRGSAGRTPRRGRGDYGGSYNRGNRSEEFVVKVDNEAEFPSLGSK